MIETDHKNNRALSMPSLAITINNIDWLADTRTIPEKKSPREVADTRICAGKSPRELAPTIKEGQREYTTLHKANRRKE
jgi:hypothetical protein